MLAALSLASSFGRVVGDDVLFIMVNDGLEVPVSLHHLLMMAAALN